MNCLSANPEFTDKAANVDTEKGSGQAHNPISMQSYQNKTKQKKVMCASWRWCNSLTET